MEIFLALSGVLNILGGVAILALLNSVRKSQPPF